MRLIGLTDDGIAQFTHSTCCDLRKWSGIGSALVGQCDRLDKDRLNLLQLSLLFGREVIAIGPDWKRKQGWHNQSQD